MSPQPDTGEVLAGLVERVTYHNAENGFCVLRARARGHRDVVTVVGHAAVISAGEWIMASGQWVNDRAHGQQFKAKSEKSRKATSSSFASSVELIWKTLMSSSAQHAAGRITPSFGGTTEWDPDSAVPGSTECSIGTQNSDDVSGNGLMFI